MLTILFAAFRTQAAAASAEVITGVNLYLEKL